MKSTNGNLSIFDTPYWSVVLNPNQTYLGRSVVLLKRPCADLAEITQEELLDFFATVQKVEKLFRVTFDATMFNWSCLMNNAYQETPPNPQVHWHCLPRYDHPVTFAGREFSDPNFGHRSVEEVRNLSTEETSQLVTLLKEGLERTS